MTDIVKRLRAYAKVWGNEPSIPPHPGTSPGFTTGMVIGDANDAADEIERLREALKKIAAYDDHLAQKHLEETGSYGAFDEPGSVGMAREALEWVCPIGNKDCKENCGNYGCGN